MIVTLTANPSWDRALALGNSLAPGEVQTALSGREDAGGKGINVARVIAAAGTPALAVLPLAPSDPFSAVVSATGLATRVVAAQSHARVNLTLTDPLGTTTKVNLPGAPMAEATADELLRSTVDACVDARWLVLAGSLPPGAGEDFYTRVIVAVREAHGGRAPLIAVDASGAPLRHVVAHGRPDLIKPNEDELADLVGVPFATDLTGRAAADHAKVLASRVVPHGARAALVTLGAAGAALVRADQAWFGRPPAITVASTVGAGDSSLAGFLLADLAGRDGGECLANAIRYGAAAASLPGTQPPAPSDLPPGDVPITSL
ncbi:1-phosphofructokinase family hexose kinase [Microbacterium sp. C7(2022)]|uniref:1-phosphofructokinase family hexose kinase n=1 Tax=Microbacterium sp. C7(2022) TaxID=2992759 RepID=UPI00237B3B28|nr:hexose kinase [Microbacterium sp. C7(2022)]MDE0545608.1 hexose kinase [Microbacterium sp. C7(2022)]